MSDEAGPGQVERLAQERELVLADPLLLQAEPVGHLGQLEDRAAARRRRGGRSNVRPSSRARTSASSTSCRPVESKNVTSRRSRTSTAGRSASARRTSSSTRGPVAMSSSPRTTMRAVPLESWRSSANGTTAVLRVRRVPGSRPDVLLGHRFRSHPVPPRKRASCSIGSATSSTADVLENARLLLSELVANAIEHVARGRRPRGAHHARGRRAARRGARPRARASTPPQRAARTPTAGWGLHFTDRLAVALGGRPRRPRARVVRAAA